VGRHEIVHAAELLFSERGYTSTSMRDIADAVGIKAGSLYAHIDTKQDLLFGIIDEASDRFLEGIEDIVHSPGPAPQRLAEAMRRHLLLIAEQLDGAKVFFHEWRSLSEEQRAPVLDKRRRYERYFVDLIEEGMRDGDFATTDSKLAATALMSLLNWSYTWLDPEGPLEPEQVAEFFADFAIRGLSKGTAAAARKRVRTAHEPASEGKTSG
jgi:AcrR family transcriptional regulator